MTPFFTVQNAFPAGCPQAPLLAKAVLAPALQPWQVQHCEVHLSSWVDDVGFDTAGRSPMAVAQKAVNAYRDMHRRLVELGLKVNPQKTAFIATDRSTDKALRELLQPDEPPVETVMRDLGVDHQRGQATKDTDDETQTGQSPQTQGQASHFANSNSEDPTTPSSWRSTTRGPMGS